MRAAGTLPKHSVGLTGTRAPAAVLAAVAVLCGQAYLVAGRGFANLVETPFLAYSLAGSFAIHFWTRPGRTERLTTVALATAAALGFVLWSGRYRADWPTSVACAGFLGLASLAVLAAQVCRLRGAEQERKLRTLVAGSVFGYSALFIALILKWTTRLHPSTYDLYLYAADAGYGIPISRWAGQFVTAHGLLLHACSFVYESLPLAVSLVYAYERSGARPIPVRVLPAFIGGGAAAYLLYNFLPAAGPHYIFGAAFPNALPDAASVRVALAPLGEAARNAVPSMHLACALLIWWCCEKLPVWVRAAAAIYLVLTILARLGFGEHYAVDLVVAVPYALALQALCVRRWPAAWLGIGLTVSWMLALRFGTPLFHNVAFAWGGTAITLILCTVGRSWIGRKPPRNLCVLRGSALEDTADPLPWSAAPV